MSTATLLIYALLCHGGVMLGVYNAANATGLPRRLVKSFSKLAFVWTLALPLIAVWQMRWSIDGTVDVPRWVQIYAAVISVLGTLAAVRWIASRPGLERTEIAVDRTARTYNLRRHTDVTLPRTRKCRWLSRVPMNQILDLSVDRIRLPVIGLPPLLQDFRIAHLSDLHLTGHIDPAMTRIAVEHAMAFEPDWIVVTGDIVDASRCIEWLPDIFAGTTAACGKHFILGNHDKRHGNTDAIRQAMINLDWRYLGGQSESLSMAGQPCEIIGNESPWYGRPSIPPSSDRFRILLSHSPDQIEWARRHNVGLMLAGHTHGGQGRLPVVGPVIAPSRYGTRFAGGDFHLSPTTMHVTRGLSGTHLLRLNCRPEVSLLTLTAVDHRGVF